MTVTAFEDSVANCPVAGFLHEPSSARVGTVVLTHGAGSDCRAPLLVAIAEVLAESGLAVLRCNLAYRLARRFGPPSPAGAARDRETLRAAVALMRQAAPGPVFLGGHSYGGRQSTMLAAESPDIADALLLLSYPLHPPKRPEQRRTEHLTKLSAPSFFAHGSCDPFGTLAEMREAVALVQGRTQLFPVEGAGHDLGRGGQTAREVAEAFLAFAGER